MKPDNGATDRKANVQIPEESKYRSAAVPAVVVGGLLVKRLHIPLTSLLDAVKEADRSLGGVSGVDLCTALIGLHQYLSEKTAVQGLGGDADRLFHELRRQLVAPS